MRVDFDMTGIDDEPFKVGLFNEHFEKLFPDSLIAPTTKATVDVVPASVIGWQIAPRGAGAKNPQNRIDKLTVVLGNASPLPRLTW